MSSLGKLFVFEGPDGVGKTTLAQALAEDFNDRGIACDYLSFPGRETNTLGQHIYTLHHDPSRFGITTINATSLQLLHIAAHIDLIERRILPALKAGKWIILDRFWWSTWVYGVISGVDKSILRAMLQVERTYWNTTLPTITFLLMSDAPHRIEQSSEIWRKLKVAYYELAIEQKQQHPVQTIVNNGSKEQALETIIQAIENIDSKYSELAPLVAAMDLSNIQNTQRDEGAQLRLTLDSDDTEYSVTAPLVISWLAPIQPSEVFDTYWRFATERQAIFFRKFARLTPPWTEDSILAQHKFTNAYRASDRVSQFMIKYVIYEGDQSPDEIFFRIILFKIFNRIETWQLLQQKLGTLTFADYKFEHYDDILSQALASGAKIFSAAYIMPSGDSSFGYTKKHRNYLKLLEHMLHDEVPARITEMRYMRHVFELLRSYPMIGNFLAYQYATDINYSLLTDFSEMEFVVPGPGAINGIRKCFQDLGGLNETDIIRLMAEHQQEEFFRLDLHFQSLWGRPLQLIDCQNLFCEVDKYARVAHPNSKGVTDRKRIKQRYYPQPEPILYWFPPRWGLNNLIAQDLVTQI